MIAGKEKDAGTAPVVELNNAPIPTEEEEVNAELNQDEVEVEDLTPEQETELDPNQDLDSVPNPEEEPINELNPEPVPDSVQEAQATRTFTQSQVDEIAGKIRKETREKTTRDIFGRYGVNTVDELDDLFGDAQRFALTQDERAAEKKAWEEADSARNAELMALKESIALLESGIDKNRYEDAKLIIRGKGLDVTAENIAQELATHPEWKPAPVSGTVPEPSPEFPFRKGVSQFERDAQPVNRQSAPTQMIVPTLGNASSGENPDEQLSERERAFKLFKV